MKSFNTLTILLTRDCNIFYITTPAVLDAFDDVYVGHGDVDKVIYGKREVFSLMQAMKFCCSSYVCARAARCRPSEQNL